MNNRWVKYLMAGSVTVLMVLVIIFIIMMKVENGFKKIHITAFLKASLTYTI